MDTIAAIATANGIGALGIIRLSGTDAVSIVEEFFKSSPPLTKLEPWRAILGRIISSDNSALSTQHSLLNTVDWAVAIKYKGPRSFTGEDMVEIVTHGSPLILRETLSLAFAFGCREALPGEFTQRAFLNGKMDLVQAEAITQLIRAQSVKAAHLQNEILSGLLSKKLDEARDILIGVLAELDVFIDHPDEPEALQDFSSLGLNSLISKTQEQLQSLVSGFKNSYKLREGFSVAIVGASNVGKSTLFNSLLSKNKAIVSPVAGTTRDALEEFLEINGTLIRLIDTAGFNEACDLLSQEARRRAQGVLERADFILWVIDGAREDLKEDRLLLPLLKDKKAIVVWNKKDLPTFVPKPSFNGDHRMGEVCVCAAQGDGLDSIKEILSEHIEGSLASEPVGLWEERQAVLTNEAIGHLRASLVKLEEEAWELVSFEIREAAGKIDTILGRSGIGEDTLRKIFSKFCIGK